MTALYNEIESYPAQWLRNLIAAGHISSGDVDERSVADLRPADVVGRTRFHAFAGIGVWDYALRLAEWPDDVPVWTGSCPCQPFSVAGKRAAHADPRHLWPEWFRLIRECRPAVIFGEQVASADVVGSQLEAAFVVAVWAGQFARANKLAKQLAQSASFHYWTRWLDVVRGDLEGIGYTVRPEILGAHSTGAPHLRQRLYFVAHTECGAAERRRPELGDAARGVSGEMGQQRFRDDGGDGGAVGLVADAQDADRRGAGHTHDARWGPTEVGGPGPTRVAADAEAGGRGARGRAGQSRHDGHPDGADPWSDLVWLPCRDGKARPTQPGLFPLAHGSAARVGRLRAYGNAIVPQVAAAFIRAFTDTQGAGER